MILTVHDELVFECPAGRHEAAVAIIRERMEQAVTLAVPLTVDVGVAANWRDAKPDPARGCAPLRRGVRGLAC